MQLLAPPRLPRHEGRDEIAPVVPGREQPANARNRDDARHDETGAKRRGGEAAHHRRGRGKPGSDGHGEEYRARHERVDHRGPLEVGAAHEKRAHRERDRQRLHRIHDGFDERRCVGEALPRFLRQAAVDDLGKARRH